MKKMHKTTYISILKSNQRLLQCINDEVPFELDDNIRIELICLYFLINPEIEPIDKAPDLASFNFYFNKKDLFINNQKHDIDYFASKILREEWCKRSYHNETEFKPLKEVKVYHSGANKKNSIDFVEVRQKYYETMRETLYNEARITDDTAFFTKTLNYNFKELVNTIIANLLEENNTTKLENVHVAFIYGLINLLINLKYNPLLPIDKLSIPRNHIRVIKGLYQTKDIRSLQEEYETTIKEKEKVLKQKYYIENYEEDNYELLKRISQRIELLDQKQYYLNTELFRLKDQPKNFNALFFSSLLKAIKEYNVEFREESINPIINVFTQSKSIIENIFEMKLTTFVNLFNNDDIIKIYDNQAMMLRLVD